MKKILRKFLKRTDPEYADISQELLKFADLIEMEALSITSFSNIWINRVYRSNIFASTAELTLLSKAIDDLLDCHFDHIGHTPRAFANGIRKAVFQFGNGAS